LNGSNEIALNQVTDLLKKYWGFQNFREPQIPIVESILSGKDTLGLMTTGGGKSICFQTVALNREGICLIISPLIALMRDQVDTLRALGIEAAAVYSDQSVQEQNNIIDACLEGRLQFLYIAPEKLRSKDFQTRLRQFPISMLVIDEAHCISQWGYDFRPSYLRIPEIYNWINRPQVVALTATATPKVIEDIIDKLELRDHQIIQQSFAKPKTSFQLIETEQKMSKLLSWIQKLKGSGIVYVNRRKSAVEISKFLNKEGIESEYYHAGLAMEIRNEKQEKWLAKTSGIMVCTNAFGMGIDNPNVNFVIHYNLSESIEAYFQEAGRAGRKGQNAYAITLVSQADRVEIKSAIEDYPSQKEVIQTLIMLFNYYQIPYESGRDQVFPFEIEGFIEKFKLPALKTQKCIQILKDQNLISLAEDYYKPDEIQILADDHYLRDLTNDKPEYGHLVKNLLRTYEGLHFRRKVFLGKLAKNYHYNLLELRTMLRNLQKWEVIFYQEATNKPTIQFQIDKLPQANIPFDNQQYNLRKKTRTEQWNAILDYTKSDLGCRQSFLLKYFGEVVQDTCGICDNCLASNAKPTILEVDFLEIRISILKALKENPSLNIQDLIRINKKFKEIYVRRVLDRLIELSLVEKFEGDTFRLS
jgi:ATP-dependent DNA helicase RecQ